MLRSGTTFLLALHELNIDTESYLWYYNININNRKGRDLKMQLRVWGTPEENNEVLNLLHQELKDKIKIVSAPYPSSNNKTQRIYIEVDLQNRNYRKVNTDYMSSCDTPKVCSNKKASSEGEKSIFSEEVFFEDLMKKITNNS